MEGTAQGSVLSSASAKSSESDDNKSSSTQSATGVRTTCSEDLRNVRQDKAWKTINSTMQTISNSLDSESISDFFNSIMKFPILLETVVIPDCKCCRIHFHDKEQECLAYSTWILGRMFYFLGCKRLSSIHQLSVEGQIRIMQLLLKLHPTLFMKIVDNYIQCLHDIIEVQKGSATHTRPFVLKRFISRLQAIGDLELDLSPCFVEIANDDECTSLLNYILTIVNSVAMGLVGLGPDVLISIWEMICYLIPQGPASIQINTLQIAANLLFADGFPPTLSTRSSVLWQSFYGYVEHLILNEKSMTGLYKDEREAVANALKSILTATAQCIHKISVIDQQFLVIVLTNMMQGQISSTIRDIIHGSISIFAKSLLDHIEDMQIDSNSIDAIVSGFSTDDYVIPGLKYCIMRELISQVPVLGKLKQRKNNGTLADYDLLFRLCERETHPTDVIAMSVLESSRTWQKLWHKLMVSVSSLEEENSCNVTRMIDLLNLVLSIVECGAAVNAMLEELLLRSFERPLYRAVFYGDSIKHILKSVMGMLCRVRSGLTEGTARNIVQISLKFVGSLMKMPEIRNLNVDDINLSIALLALPWIGDVTKELITDQNHVIYIIRRDYRPYSCELKLACIQNLACIESDETFSWRLSLFQLIISKEDSNLVAEAVRNVPFLLAGSSRRCIQDAIIDLLMPAFRSEHSEVQIAVSDSFAKVVCALAGTCVIVRESLNSVIHPKVMCMKCTYEERNYPCFTYAGTIQEMLLKVTSFIMSPIVKIRRNIALSLPSLSNHLPSFRETTSLADWGPFLRDLDHDVRLYFSQYASCLVFDSKWMQEKKHESEESGEEFIPLSQVDREELWTSEPLLVEFCDMLIHAVRQSLEIPTDPCQETLIYTVKNIGCIALDCVLYPSLMLLLTFVGHPNGNNAGLAKICLGDIARAHNVVPKDLFVRFKPELCWVMVKVAIGTHLSSSKKNFVCTVAKLAKLFDFDGEKQFFRKESHHVMPCLIAELVKNVRARPILDQVAALMVTTPKELIEVEFQHIYPHIVVSESEAVLTECIEYMKELCSQPVASLISRSFVVIRNELLLEFQSKRDRVLESLRYLASIDPNFKTSSPHLTLEQIADFLQPYFLGVLVHFDGRLTTNDVSESVKQKALLSLPELIRLMGPRHITLVRFKVLATLRIALRLNYSNFPDLSIAAWDAFVHSLEDSSLGPLLSTIFASLLPLLDQFPEEIASIFKYLIVDKQQDLWFYFKELYFVPQHPALKEIHATIQQYAKRYGPKTCYGKLREKLTYVIHENMDVRLHALKDMGVLLSESRFQLNEATVNKEKVEPCIIEMLNVLTDACHDPDERVKMAAGECLGEIGAVDPGIIPHRKCAEGSNLFALDVEQPDFAVLAINQLARGFQKATNITTVDAFSYAIQELLKVYEIQCDGPLWQRFLPNVQDIMKPLLRSSYRSLVKLEVSYPKPIYGSKLGSSLRDWSSNWALQLLSLVSDKRAQDVFNSCTLVFKRDLPTVLFFLPYILLHALTSCSELDRSDILLELTTLLENPDPARLSGKGAGPLREPLMLAVQNQSADSILPRSIDPADHVRCCRTAFQLVDFLARWLRQFRNSCGRHVDPMKNKNFKTIYDFLNKMSKLSIARGNYECQEYARALMYLEQYIKENESELQNQLWFFEELYVHLDDPDAVAGTLAIQGQEPSLKQMARAHEVTGQYQNAAACYEQMAQEQMLTPEQVQGMVRCYLSLDQPFTSLKIAEGVIAERPELAQDIHQEYAESLWRMHKFNELEQLVSSPPLANNRTWGVQIGRALLHFRRGDHAELASVLADTKRAVLESLGSMERQHGMYYHSYSDVVKLHILYELEKMSEMLASVVEFSQGSAATSGAASVLVRNLLEEWDQRLAVVQKCSRAVEPILCLRRIVLDQARCILKERDPESAALLNAEIGNCWLRSAKAARKESYHQQAYIYILNAEKYKPPSLFIEKAKLYWEKGDQESAFHTLKRCLEEQFPDAHLFKDMTDRKSERMLCAKAKLLIAMYNDETLKVDTDQSVKNYTSAVHACQQWEKSLVCLAQFYDRLFQGLSDDDKDTKGGEMQLGMVNYFGKSMHHGTKYIYQSMPRMLTLWLDYGSRHADVMKRGDATPSQNSDVETLTRKLTELIASFAKSLPPYQFFTAFSQLVSRICHPKPIVWEQLKTIIVNILIAYPQHALWMLMAPLKSCYAVRAKRCQEILQHPKVREANLMKMVSDYNNLTDKLIDLTNLPVPDKTDTTTVSSLVQSLPALLTSDGFSEIIMPTEQYLNFVLPTMGLPQNHNPFPQKLIYIKIIKDEVTILASLQKPRRITFIGSDGMSYPMMCKPKDDLRKDFRLMEFNGIVNRYLRKDPDSRQRGLHIRTYSVIPLNEECGILEWMPNLVGLRPTLLSMYKQIGVSPSGRVMKEMVHSRHEPFEKKKALFLKIMETLPPILSEWFLITYPDPQSWYLARTTYIQTTAVMSMVGYILGLGDRHGENFLLDTKTGDAVHVDFNCLFNKGDNFDWPEVVPFRLTHNMVNAMGPMGVEGPFRRVCEITLRILRSQSDTLMSVLRPFVYDPIISWGKCRPNGGRKRDQVEMTNENAVQNLTRIERRLQGMVRNVGKCYAIPLSVEGQANSLILEATNVDNLCRMYVGWGAFL